MKRFLNCQLEDGKLRLVDAMEIEYISETSDPEVCEIMLVSGRNFGVKVHFNDIYKLLEYVR